MRERRDTICRIERQHRQFRAERYKPVPGTAEERIYSEYRTLVEVEREQSFYSDDASNRRRFSDGISERAARADALVEEMNRSPITSKPEAGGGEAPQPNEGQPKATQSERPKPPVQGPRASRGRERFELEPLPGETLGVGLGVEAAPAHAKQPRAKRPRPKKAAKRKAGAKANVTRPEAAKQYPTSLGRNIDRLRKDCGWSFDELAKKTGIEKKLILAHVNEGTRPQPRIAKLYADAFTKALGRPISASDLEK